LKTKGIVLEDFLDIHIFEYNDSWFVFDSRNYSIIKTGQKAALVLSSIACSERDAIIKSLYENISEDEVNEYYDNWGKLIEDGIFSTGSENRKPDLELNSFVILLTSRCNMRCRYCFESDMRPPHALDLTNEMAGHVVDWIFLATHSRQIHIEFYGGEPLVNFKVLRYLVDKLESTAKIHERELQLYLITNGTLISESIASWLQSHSITVQVSVDGSAESHDRNRIMASGAPSSLLVKNGIKHLKNNKVAFNLRAVMTRNNVDPGELLKELCTFETANASFEVVATNNPEIKLGDRDWGELVERYRMLLGSYNNNWYEMPWDLRQTIERIVEGRHIVYGCGGGRQELTIYPNGDIYTCQRLMGDLVGNIAHGTQIIHQQIGVSPHVDSREPCRNCFARYLCGGGCMHQSRLETLTDQPFTRFCEMKQSLVMSAIALISEIKTGAIEECFTKNLD